MHPYEFDTDRRGRVASAALDIALDAIIVIDRGGAVVEWNPSAEATFQWRRREAVGRPIADLIIPPHLREAHLEGLSRFLTTGAGPALDRRLTLPGVRKDGTELVVELTISTLESAGEQLFVGWLRDVTEFIEARLETERASLRFVALAQSLADGVIFVDSRQEIVFVNQAFCDLFGLDTAPDDLAGRPTSAIRPTADALVADAAGFGREIVRRVEGGASARSPTRFGWGTVGHSSGTTRRWCFRMMHRGTSGSIVTSVSAGSLRRPKLGSSVWSELSGRTLSSRRSPSDRLRNSRRRSWRRSPTNSARH